MEEYGRFFKLYLIFKNYNYLCLRKKQFELNRLFPFFFKMTLNVGIRKLIKSYIESGFDASIIYKMLIKTV